MRLSKFYSPRTPLLLCLGATLLSVGCLGEVISPEPETPSRACLTPLSLDPAARDSAPDAILPFRATGGTGEVEFFMVSSESGGQINEASGVYLAGTSPGQDVVGVRDLGCDGEARAEVTVLGGIQILPQVVHIAPGDSLQFMGDGGSGEYLFALETNTTGSTLSETGRYTAGLRLGTDVVTLEDARTGERAEAPIYVVSDPSIAPEVSRIFLPVGSTYDVNIEGVPRVELSTSADFLSIEGERISAILPGEATVEVRDPFGDRMTTLTVTAIPPSAYEGQRYGEHNEQASFSAAEDIDGDGRAEVAYGAPYASAGGYRSGAVFILGREGSELARTPTQSIVGPQRDMRFGQQVEFIDIDGDSQVEMVVSAPGADVTGRDNGSLYFYRIGEDGNVASEPYFQLYGSGRFDNFGYRFTTCDFNGDGELDFAVGAPDDENGEAAPIAGRQGAVHLFLGRGEGVFRLSPDQTLYGEAPQLSPEGEASWVGVRDARLGRALTAGDFDGDGLCDLVANGATPSGAGNHGFVVVHRGRAGVEGDRGGVDEHAALRISGEIEGNPNGQLGRYMDMGDFDGDGAEELVVSHQTSRATDMGGAGAVHLIPGQRLSAMPTTETQLPAEAAIRSYLGVRGNDNFGSAVAAADVNADGLVDLVVAAPAGQAAMSELRNPGVVQAFFGVEGDYPASAPSREIEGRENGQRYGHGMRVVGQLVGAGAPDIMAVTGYGMRLGWRVPEPSAGQFSEATTGEGVDTPGSPAGTRLGRSVAIVGDVNGDGFPDLVAGAPYEARLSWNGRRGAAYLFLGNATGFETTPAVSFSDFPNHGGDFGYTVAAAGDINGDGVDDIAVLAPFAAAPGDIADTSRYVVADTCIRDRTRGVVSIFLGSSSGLPSSSPAFMFVTPRFESGNPISISGRLNFDGDDLGDLIVSGTGWRIPGPINMETMEPEERFGGFVLFRGNYPDMSGRIVVFCEPAYVGLGPARDSEFGVSATSLGDLNADGCDELAVGDWQHNLNEDNRSTGRVTVYTGFDGVSCPESEPQVLTLDGRVRSAGAGNALDGGVDLDGDGLSELIVGARFFRDGRGERGRAYLVRGSYIRDQLIAGPSAFLVDPAEENPIVLTGESAGERFGFSVALTPRLGVVDRPGIIIGAPFGSYSGRGRSGSVLMYAFEDGTVSETPVAILAGDAVGHESNLGHSVDVHATETSTSLVVGAPWSSAVEADFGAVFGVQLTP